MNKGRLLGGVGAGALALSLFAGTAGAHTPFGTVDIDNSANSDGFETRISGTLTCSAGETFRVGARIIQDNDLVASGFDPGNNCTGAPQTFLVSAFGPVDAGSASVTVTIYTALPETTTLHGPNRSVIETVAISIPDLGGDA